MSRSKREGRYAGYWDGKHVRAKAGQKMPRWALAMSYTRHRQKVREYPN